MRLRTAAGVVALLVAAAACSGASMGSSRTVRSRPGQFRLDEWSITADQPVLRVGRQTITAANIGHHTHELVIVKVADAASLPTNPDGSVDENQLDRIKVGEIADVPAGTSQHTTMTLSAGSYVAFCNIVRGTGMGNGPMGGMGGGMRHVHFALGMHTEFTVRS